MVESLDDDHDILYSAYSCGFFLLSNRDFLYFEGNALFLSLSSHKQHSGRRHHKDGSKVVACFSIERDDVPPVKGYVRAHICHSGWVVKPFEGDDGQEWCQATFCAQVDPKGECTLTVTLCANTHHRYSLQLGWIPHKLVNFFSGELAKTIYNIQEYLEKEKSGIITKKAKKHKKKLRKKMKAAQEKENKTNEKEVVKEESDDEGSSESKEEEKKTKKD